MTRENKEPFIHLNDIIQETHASGRTRLALEFHVHGENEKTREEGFKRLQEFADQSGSTIERQKPYQREGRSFSMPRKLDGLGKYNFTGPHPSWIDNEN